MKADFRQNDTPQKIFDTVLRVISEQGPSMGYDREGEYVCRYRGEHDRECAVGIFIPDQFYDKAMEGGLDYKLLRGLRSKGDSTKEFVDWLERNKELLGELQIAHDEAASWREKGAVTPFKEDFRERMEFLAKKFGLNFEGEAL